MLLPLAGRISTSWLMVGVLVLAQLFFGMGLTVFQIVQVSLRQSLTPDHLQGRMNATLSMLTWGIVPLGGLMGGVLGQELGLSLTLMLAAFGEMIAVFWLVFSPVRMIRHTGEV